MKVGYFLARPARNGLFPDIGGAALSEYELHSLSIRRPTERIRIFRQREQVRWCAACCRNNGNLFLGRARFFVEIGYPIPVGRYPDDGVSILMRGGNFGCRASFDRQAKELRSKRV